jgi:peptidyl-prolyl cis-trans isomerase D
MLQSIRQMAHSWIIKSLMLFLVVSFSIWGIGDMFRGNSLQKTVASVGRVNISVQQLNQLFERALVEAKQKISPNLTAQQARQMGLMDQALNGEITRQLIDMDIARQGINVGPDVVLKMISEEPQFRNEDGSFNKKLFRQLLEQQRMSEGAFLAQGQVDMSRQLLLKSLNGILLAPQTMVDALFKARAQRRTLDVVTIDADKIGGIPAPDDKALHDFYDKNPQFFEMPEYRSLTIALLSTEAIEKDISITDDQLKKEFEAKSDQLSSPERRDIVQVVLQDETKAKQLAASARAKGDLPKAASEIKETAIPLEQVEKKTLMPALSETVFGLREGGIGDPVKTQLGWHVIQLKKISSAGAPSFDKVKDKLRQDMRRDQAIEEATRIVNKLDDQLAAGNSLDDIADGLRMRLVKIQAVDSRGLMSSGKAPSEFPNKGEVLKFAFGQNAGETSPVADDKAGSYYTVRTDDVTPAGVRPFAEVKDKAAAAWKAHEQKLKAQAKAEKIAKALGEGAGLSSFDKEEGVSSRTSSPLSLLGETDRGLPASLVAKAFKLKKGETATQDAEDKQIVVRLAGIEDVDAEKADTRKNMISGEIKKAESNELIDQYLQYLRTQFPVKLNTALLDRMKQREE